MPSPFVSIESLCQRVTSGGTPSRKESGYFASEGTPWVKTQELTDGVLWDTLEYITPAAVSKSAAKILPADTILVAMYGATVGKLGILGIPMACNQACCALLVDKSRADHRFVFYALKCFREDLASLANGAAQQNLNAGIIKRFKIPDPGLEQQKAIAAVLGALDDKIAVNEHIAATARDLAVSLVQEATDRDRVEVKLGAVTRLVVRGIAPRYVDESSGMVVLNQKCIRDGRVNLGPSRLTSPISGAKKLLQHGDVLVNSTGVGTLGRVARWIAPIEATADSHVTIVRFVPSVIDPLSAALAMIRMQPDIEALGHGSTGQTELNRERLLGLSMPVPARDSQLALAPRLAALELRGDSALAECASLAVLRDTLLPKLMSGELRVRDAEHIVGEAT